MPTLKSQANSNSDNSSSEIDENEIVVTKMERMNHRDSRVPYMFYPEDNMRNNWDMFITVVLLWTCITTPARIAFVEDDTPFWAFIKWAVDFMFLIDIIIIFNSAVQDEDFITIDDRKEIALMYLSGWFLLDVFAIIPFSEMMSGNQEQGSSENLNEMVRLAKLGRLYKLIKLTKLLRVLKILKQRSKLLKYVRNVVNLGYGFERLTFILLLFIMITHIVACLWVFFASFSDNYENTWMEDGYNEMDGSE